MSPDITQCAAAGPPLLLVGVLVYYFRRDQLKARPTWVDPAVSDLTTLTENEQRVIRRQFVALIGCIVVMALLILTAQLVFLGGISILLGYVGVSAIRNRISLLGVRIFVIHQHTGLSAILMGVLELALAIVLWAIFIWTVIWGI